MHGVIDLALSHGDSPGHDYDLEFGRQSFATLIQGRARGELESLALRGEVSHVSGKNSSGVGLNVSIRVVRTPE